MSVVPIDLGRNPVNRAPKLRRFWHRPVEWLDALVAYPINNAVSQQELRRVDEDIKRCRELGPRTGGKGPTQNWAVCGRSLQFAWSKSDNKARP
jgi:hypothetical protein